MLLSFLFPQSIGLNTAKIRSFPFCHGSIKIHSSLFPYGVTRSSEKTECLLHRGKYDGFTGWVGKLCTYGHQRCTRTEQKLENHTWICASSFVFSSPVIRRTKWPERAEKWLKNFSRKPGREQTICRT
jgi:hypothetical protein